MDSIKKYSVKINYKLQGSGVLVKVDEDNCYLITAKHNFKKGEDESHNNVDTSSLNFDEIKISNPNNDNLCKIEKIVYEEKKLDLLIFKIQNNSDYIKNLPTLEIVKDRHILYKKHFFYGFPNGKETPSGELTPLAFKVKEDEKHILYLRGDKTLYIDEEKGFSGSGVFIKDGNKDDGYTYYLTGIVTEVYQDQSLFETISLSEIIIDKINLSLNPKIEVKEDIIDIGFSQNIYTRILNRNKETSLVKKILNKLGKNKKLFFLKENESERKEIIKILDMDENELLKLEKELADLYLLKAIIYHSDNNDKKTTYFKKATKFNSRYKNYQFDNAEESEIDEIENNNEKFNFLQKAKLYLIEEKYDKVIELLEKENIEQLENSEKSECYECLVKSYQEKGIIENAITYGENILGLLKSSNENNILEKAEMSYKLSLFYEQLDDKDEALNRAIEGLEFLDENKENSFLEIKYKLEKQKKKLSNSIEDRPLGTLTELFKQNPERYLDEYLENLRNETREITNKDILDEIKVIQQQIKKC